MGDSLPGEIQVAVGQMRDAADVICTVNVLADLTGKLKLILAIERNGTHLCGGQIPV